ncbi:MAG: NEW3 domain-containing protein [Solirubrobacterales bacterium]
MFFATFAILLFCFNARSAEAAESPFKIEFDQSELQIGAVDSLPLDDLGTKAILEGTVSNTGYVQIPEGGFKLPEVGLTEPITIKGYMGINGPMTGRFDETTGSLELTGKAGIWVSVNPTQLLDLADGLGIDVAGTIGLPSFVLGFLGNDLSCGFSPMDIKFSTVAGTSASGAPFTKGPLGPGALSAEWSKLGPFAGKTQLPLVGDACVLLKSLLPGLISGLGSGTDLGGFDLGSLIDGIDLSNLDNVDLGPSSITLTRSLDEAVPVVPGTDPVEPSPAKIKLAVSPKNKKAKAGSKVKYTAKVKNVGGTKATGVKVCAQAPKKAAKVKRCQSLGTITPGNTKTRKFKVKIKKSASKRSYRIGFTVKSGSGTKSSARTGLRVR